MAETDKASSGAAAIEVRSMSVDDFPAVCRLLTELGRPAPTDETLPQVRRVFERHLASADTSSLIALRDGAAVGLLTLHFRERLSQPVPEAWIPDFVVTADEQGRGAAHLLMHRAMELARARGCHRVALESHYHRHRAYRFYAREGFTDVGKCFSLPLDPPPPS
ncbi:MAG TPA: GNAT family N-acetyltransferase [Pirellulales bacterium]|nr:GNAT family N-acetyltransferase [Pirellulales bacterium]